jgi:hypothetical protein
MFFHQLELTTLLNVVSIHPTLTPVQPYWLSPRLLITTPRAPSHIESTLRCRLSFLLGLLTLEDGTHCPETSVNNYHTTSRNTPEDRRSNLEEVVKQAVQYLVSPTFVFIVVNLCGC